MRPRIVLTGLWLLAFVGALLLIEGYSRKLSNTGVLFLLPEQRVDTAKPLITLYGGYLSGILGFWYLQPFKSARSSKLEKRRFVLAVICALIFNLIVLYVVAEFYFSRTPVNGYIEDQVMEATKVAGLLSFLVAPMNLYYFGMKTSSAASSGN